MKYIIFATELGTIILVGDNSGVTQLLVDNDTQPLTFSPNWTSDDSMEIPVLAVAKQQIIEYAQGQRREFTVKLNPTGTTFQQQCWDALCTIPFGETRTYGEQAKLIGNPRGARAVGLANNRNPIPILIPCHRVIGADGKLTGYAYGLALKQQLLQLES